jgi:hypothetical protein
MQVARDELEAARMVLHVVRRRCVELGMRRRGDELDGEAPVTGKMERRHGTAASEGEGRSGTGGAPGGGVRYREEEAGRQEEGARAGGAEEDGEEMAGSAVHRNKVMVRGIS